MDIEAVTPQHITHMLARICAEGHGRTAEAVYTMCRAALPAACMTDVKRPRFTRRTVTPWTDAEMRVYLDACATHPHGLALRLGLLMGLRRGEICGLTWENVDLSANLIHICTQRLVINGELVDAPPKSATSARVLPIPAALRADLKRAAQLTGRVCALTPSGLDQAHRTLVKRLSLPPLTLHGLRHTMATAAIRHGADMRSLQAVLGHSSYAVTANMYTHPDNTMLATALDSVTRQMVS